MKSSAKFFMLDPVALAGYEPTFARQLDEGRKADHPVLEEAYDKGAWLFPIPADQDNAPLEFWAGYLQAQVEKLQGEDGYRALIVNNPFKADNLHGFQIVLLPPGAATYVLVRNGHNEPEHGPLHTFSQGLSMAWNWAQEPNTYSTGVAVLDKDGQEVGEYLAYYEGGEKRQRVLDAETADQDDE